MSDKRDLWPEVPEVDLGTIIRPREAHRCEDRWICRALRALEPESGDPSSYLVKCRVC